MSALKMTAERIAEKGLARLHDVQGFKLRVSGGESRRNDREILRHVIGDTEGCERAAGHQHLLAGLHHFDELRWVGVQVDHVAGLFGRLGAGVHRHRDIRLRQRRRIVRAIAGHGDEPAFGLMRADQAQLSLGRCLGQKVIDPRFGRNRRRGERDCRR